MAGVAAVAYDHFDSRAGDPQLHTHVVIANRVKSPDGRWLALDARLIKHDQQTLSAIYHAGLRAELTDLLLHAKIPGNSRVFIGVHAGIAIQARVLLAQSGNQIETRKE